MTALEDSLAFPRWQRVVEAIGAQVTGPGQAEMPCPVHGGDNARGFAIGVGDSPYPLLRCRTKCDRDETWLSRAIAALIDLGAPADCLIPVDGTSREQAKTSTAAKPARPKPLPTDSEIAKWEQALWRADGLRLRLCKAWRLDEGVVGQAEVGWVQARDRYAFPVRDESGAVVQVIYRSLTEDPKSMTHVGVRGAHLYVPFDMQDGTVLLCAGERDVFAATGAGWNAVTVTNGESSIPDLQRLAGRDVVVVYDADNAGRKNAPRVATAVSEVAGSVKVADLRPFLGDDPARKDVSDLLAMKGGKALLRQAIDDAAPWAGESGDDDVLEQVRAEFLLREDQAEDHLADLLSDEDIAKLEPIEYVIDSWVPMGTYTVVYGEPGVGKTLALLGMTRAVRKGTRWQDHDTRPGATLYYQGEGVRQFKDRIDAWDAAYPTRDDQDMRPGASTERTVDLAKPEGVAAVIRTVRRYGEEHGTPVRLLVIDPLVEFMTGEENGEGMERASRGLRALAKLLDIGVVVGHHSNASGERERGAAFLRMRAGAFVRMENLDEAGQSIGLLQHKQRNGAKVALTLEMRKSEDSVVLEYTGAMLAEDYVAEKEGAKRRQKESVVSAQRRDAEALLIAAVQAQPGIAKEALITGCLGKGSGRKALTETLAGLVSLGRLRMEGDSRNAQRHYLGDS